MSNRVKPGQLRRELRFSSELVEQNLASINTSLAEVKPLIEALDNPRGLLGLYGSELLLVEKALGISGGIPAVDLVGELVSIKSVPAGTGVSYGYLSTTADPTRLGLVGIGFSDGLPRSATNQFSVEVNGFRCPGLGRIAMDQCVIDLADREFKAGSEVSFFNQHFSLADWASVSGFTQLEILGRITARVTRTWSK
jgi:alanine racemase